MQLRLMMDRDVPAAQYGGWIVAIYRVELVIVDQPIAVAPDPDPEFVLTVAPWMITINARQRKTIVAAAINRAGAFELCLPAGNHQPLEGPVMVTTGGLLIGTELSYRTKAKSEITVCVLKSKVTFP